MNRPFDTTDPAFLARASDAFMTFAIEHHLCSGNEFAIGSARFRLLGSASRVDGVMYEAGILICDRSPVARRTGWQWFGSLTGFLIWIRSHLPAFSQQERLELIGGLRAA